jgi:transposase InsO family protein
MPWREQTAVSLRKEFGQRASKGETISQLCREFKISRKTGHKWLERYADGEDLADRSRRPHHSPRRSAGETEATVMATRLEYGWGGRKIHHFLLREGYPHVPNPSTITQILKRNGLIDREEARKHHPYQRFEMEQPNQLWQMDFKGYRSLINGASCHPLTVLDDCSRYLLTLAACQDETRQTVENCLTLAFKEYGLPERMLMDNGHPWGCTLEGYTMLGVWLIRLGIKVSHGRPRHPQTQGKDERIHRTMDVELLNRRRLETMADYEQAFREWRHIYNHERPHESLGFATPGERYQRSPRELPLILPPICYDRDYIVRKVDAFGQISFKGKAFRIGKAFDKLPVGLRPTDEDGVFEVFFCHQKIIQIDLRARPKV